MDLNAYCGPGFGGWLLHGPFFMMVIGLIVVFALSRLFAGRQEAKEGIVADSAMSILRQRYAHGEISEEEYQQRKDSLRK